MNANFGSQAKTGIIPLRMFPLPTMLLECRNVRFCIPRFRDAFAHNVTDGHFIVDIEALCDDVLAVEFVADDARANGVAIQTDKQVEKCSAVADFDVSRAVEIDGCEWFFGKVERVEIALFVSQVREWLEVCQRDFFFFRKWIARRHKHVKRGCKKRFKYEVILLYELRDNLFVFITEVEHAHFAFHFGNIVNDFICLRFTERKVVAGATELADNIDKRVYRKGIMLAADGEDGIAALATFIAVFQKRRLFQNLPGVREELIAFVCNGHAFVGAIENRHAHFFFEFVDSSGKAWLRDKNTLGGFGNISRVCNGDGVFKLL